MTEIPKKGDWYKWDRLNISVTRVSKVDGWADILVEDPGQGVWTKRQPLPFPNTFIRIAK